MGMRGPRAAPEAEQKAKGARPNRVKQAAQAAASAHAARLGPPPEGLPEELHGRWEFVRVHFTHLKEADSILVRNLVLAQADLDSGELSRADRTALRKEIAAYLANMGCLPWQRSKFADEGGADATASAMAAFDG